MMNLETKPKKLSSGTRPVPKGSLGHQVSSDPFLDWVLILAFSLLVALILVGQGTSVYLGTTERLSPANQASVRKGSAPIDEAMLDKTLQSFSARADERSAILRSYKAIPDPSLP